MARNNLWRTIVVASVVAFLTGLVPGCGSDDDDNMQTNSCVALQNSATPAPNTVVALDGSSGDCGFLRVDLLVTDVSDLFGANLTVTFPQTQLAYFGASEAGSVLTSGAAVDLQVSESSPGELTVGITRLSDTGIDVQGGALLLRLDFRRIASQGSGSLGVSGSLLDSSTPPAPIPDTELRGATVVIFQS